MKWLDGKILDCKTYDEVLEILNYDAASWQMRLKAYRIRGFTKEALNDREEDIRREAYETFGFTENALNDPYWAIRLVAYRTRGFTEKALEDKNEEIKREAKVYFHFKKLKEEYENKLQEKSYTFEVGKDKNKVEITVKIK